MIANMKSLKRIIWPMAKKKVNKNRLRSQTGRDHTWSSRLPSLESEISCIYPISKMISLKETLSVIQKSGMTPHGT